MSVPYAPPRLLAPGDELDGFVCGSVEQTNWLRRHARQAHAANSAKVLVVTEVDSSAVVAYYAWCMASVRPIDLPARHRKGVGAYPQPVALLARLGVDTSHEGHGVGSALLADVIRRAAILGSEIGCRALLVHCETDDARAFYLHHAPEFEPSPTDELHLTLLMKDLLRLRL
ncbi:MAG TPA: GNAT family N-acetyltransferase [Ilumatobacter sp.]|nr:GNAT family N-acetyltransferase [Ilumatobacter sp.]